MRDWATCEKEVAGVLPKGVGRSRALYHESTFFPRTYSVKVQVYNEVGKDLGIFATIGRECGLIFQQQFGLISVTRARVYLAYYVFSYRVPTISNSSSKILFARDSNCAM